MSGNSLGAPYLVDQVGNDRKRGPSGWVKWVLVDPLPEEVAELAQWYLEVVELSEDEVKGETDEWLARGLVARSLS